MNRLLYTIAAFLIWNGLNIKASGEYILDPTSIPESSFQNVSNGIAIGLALKNRIEGASKTYFIDVYLRNGSQTDLYLFRHPAIARVEIYYINDSGIQIPLRKYVYSNNISANGEPIVIKPRHVLFREIALDENEWKVVKTHSVIFKCNIFGSYSKLIKITTQPQKLTLP